MPAIYCVKAKKKAEKTWRFLGSGGTLQRLRLHALQMSQESAQKLQAEIERENLDYEAKVVLFATNG